MPAENNPVAGVPAPSPSPAPASAPSSPSTATAPASRPAAEPKSARPQSAAPSIKPPLSSTRKRPTLSAERALKLESPARKEMDDVVAEGRKKLGVSSPVSAEYKEPIAIQAPAVPVAAAPEPAAPVATPAVAAVPAAPTAPAKIKVGGKEYTEEELAAALAPKNEPAPQAAPAEPAPAPRQPTQEEITAAETKYVSDVAAAMEAPLSEEEMDTILAGGKDAVSTLQNLRKRDMANTILQTRKSLAESLNPLFNQVFGALKPLVDNFQAVQRYSVEQQFVSDHPDFAPHVNTARQVAEELIRLYPDKCNQMSRQQFTAEVARQTDNILTAEHKRWFPQGNGNWRTAPAAPPAPQAAPTAPVPAPAPPMAAPIPAPPAAPTRSAVRPPAVAAPVISGMSVPANWGSAVAKSLR